MIQLPATTAFLDMFPPVGFPIAYLPLLRRTQGQGGCLQGRGGALAHIAPRGPFSPINREAIHRLPWACSS